MRRSLLREPYPTLIANLLPGGMRGFLLAALAGAITSSLASMLNSASTIFSLHVFQRLYKATWNYAWRAAAYYELA